MWQQTCFKSPGVPFIPSSHVPLVSRKHVLQVIVPDWLSLLRHQSLGSQADFGLAPLQKLPLQLCCLQTSSHHLASEACHSPYNGTGIG